MQQQYFDKNIALSFYQNIACENRSPDESLTVPKLGKMTHWRTPFLLLAIFGDILFEWPYFSMVIHLQIIRGFKKYAVNIAKNKGNLAMFN
jgi:hypothetical protein